MAGNEEDVIRYYERFWSKSELWWETDKTLGIHLGYYDKGIRSHTEAVFYMNDFSWQLLRLNAETPGQILDAGCGVGGTSIYLAKKYPQVSFTGITIVPTHVIMADRFAHKRHVTANTQFLLQNYCQTSFPNNSFDGIIALESINYARKNEDLIKEMYRVLKPGGRVAIIDGFRTDKPIPSPLKKVYQIWLDGRALIDLEPINDFATCMKHQGFRDVTVSDISSHVVSSYFLAVLIGALLFIPALTKTIIRFRHHDYSEDFDCFMAVSLASGLLALYGCFKYYAITATK
jgi:cyclopropane fatty-acyl-phospholipid synthase-like methyltransferase